MEKDNTKYRKNPFLTDNKLGLSPDDAFFLDSFLKPYSLVEYAKLIVLRRDIFKILNSSMEMSMNSMGGFFSKAINKLAPPNYNVPLNNQAVGYVLGSLEFLKENNYIIDQEKIIKEVSIIDDVKSNKNIDFVCVSTANRPEQLKKFLEECQKVQQSDKSLSIIVSDGSLDLDKCKANKDVIKQMKEVFKDLYYFDNRKREEISEILSEEIDLSIGDILYGLTESREYYSGGTAKNYMLLATAGKNIAMFDDDVVLSDTRTFDKLQKNVLTYTSSIPLNQVKYENLESVGGEKTEKNIIQLLQDVIGKTINELNEDRKIELDEVNDRLLLSAKNKTGSIKMATLGHFGHSAMWSQDGCLRMNYNKETHISHKSVEEYQKLKNYNFITNIADSDLMYDGNSFVSLNFALDNTTICPFFEPTGRSEDSIFISFFRDYHPESYQYIFREAVHHKRPETWDILYDVKSRLSPDNILSLLIRESYESTHEEGDSIDQNYQKAGEYIVNLAKLDDKEFFEKIKKMFQTLTDIFYFENGFALYLNKDGNDQWRKDLEKDMETLVSLKKGEIDLRYYGQKEKMPINDLKKMLYDFGSFQRVWPKLWNISKDLNIDFFAERI